MLIAFFARCARGVPVVCPWCTCGSLGLNGTHWSEALEALVAREFLEVAQDPDLRRKEQWSKTAAAQVRAYRRCTTL